MGTKLYVGNLTYNTSEARIREVFSADGREVSSVALIMDRETGRPRGFAFVEFASDAAAQAAMQALDGQDLDGRPLRITEARERDARGPSSGPRPGGFGGGAGGFGGAPSRFGGGPSAPSGPRPGGFGGPRPGGYGGPAGATPTSEQRKKKKDAERKDAARPREDRGGARRRRDDDDS